MAHRFPPPAGQPKKTPNSAIFALMGLLLVLSILGAAYLLGGQELLALLKRPEPQTQAALDPGVSPTATAAPTDTPAPPTPTPTPSATATPTATSTVTPTPTPSATPTPARLEGRINGAVVNLRGGPGANYPVLGQVLAGQSYTATARDESGEWLRICCPITEETESWISAQFVDLAGDLQSLPVAEAPPTPTPAPVANAGGDAAAQAASQAVPIPVLPGPGGFGPPGGTNPLTGLPLAPDLRNRRPLIVCINNDFAARPQYGTGQADVMVEYIMEGFSITRFSGIFYGEQAERIGPVRSARLVNYYLGALYDAATLCSGASDPVRFLLRNDAPFPYLDVDLDDPTNSVYSFSLGQDYRTRLQTSTGLMRKWLAERGLERAPNIRGFTFGDVPGGGAPASIVSIPYPQVTGSQVRYQYDATSGRYLRFLGGQPHLDGGSGTQLALDNVIVQYVPHEITDIVEDSLGSRSIRLNLFGSGKAIVFRNGLAFEGVWRSESQGDTPRFYDAAGNEIPLKPGRSWISIVPLDYIIAYQ